MVRFPYALSLRRRHVLVSSYIRLHITVRGCVSHSTSAMQGLPFSAKSTDRTCGHYLRRVFNSWSRCITFYYTDQSREIVPNGDSLRERPTAWAHLALRSGYPGTISGTYKIHTPSYQVVALRLLLEDFRVEYFTRVLSA